MQNLQEKIKKMLLLSDEDIEPLLKGDLKTLLVQNKEGAIRVAIAYGACIVLLLFFLFLFSLFGLFGKFVLIFLLFGSIAALAVLAGEKNILRITAYPACSYFLLFIFAVMALSMFSDIASKGAFFSKFILFCIIVGLGYGGYKIHEKAKERGMNLIQLVLMILILTSFLLSLQASAVQFSVDRQIETIQKMQEERRQEDAEKMRMSMSMASTKVCTTDEECRKMNTKKHSYYAEYEEIAQEACENAVAKEITGRFEWTVSAKDYKFTSYEVDVLNDDILLMGDRAQLISNEGEKTKISYSCHYNTKKKTTTATVREEGK